MKIERISDNSIRVTLNKEDLEDKGIKLTDLAYGTETAVQLFHDMMEQANEEVGFEVNNAPLMVEAIPVSADSLILIINRVDEPDELDSRFARFSHLAGLASKDRFEEDEDEDDKVPTSNRVKKPTKESIENMVFEFPSIEEAADAAIVIDPSYSGKSTLYKDPVKKVFYLIMSKDKLHPEIFLHSCMLLSEYGNIIDASDARKSYIMEHCKVIIKDQAVSILSSL